jgi:hypothetical protein
MCLVGKMEMQHPSEIRAKNDVIKTYTTARAALLE